MPRAIPIVSLAMSYFSKGMECSGGTMARQRAISQGDFLIALITVSSSMYKLSLSPLLRQLSIAVRLMVRTYSYCIA
ncbi:hypothetical protein [Prochlorococcus marinus]|uniref:hypothetical protein n=2 Tax=Prochlorococcus marinus TaxID=1219 RepID=UPI001C6518D3|nr:hypothetical protein [Prochlorococcus marinus]